MCWWPLFALISVQKSSMSWSEGGVFGPNMLCMLFRIAFLFNKRISRPPIGESSSSVHGSRPFIEYENLPGNSSEDSLHVAFSELIKATVSNLLPGEGYYIRVKARNDLGWSEHVFEPEYNVFHTESTGRLKLTSFWNCAHMGPGLPTIICASVMCVFRAWP